jgi:hypothetical protein
MREEDPRNELQYKLLDLPVRENVENEDDPEFYTSIVWEFMYWSAIKIAWQRLWYRWPKNEGGNIS